MGLVAAFLFAVQLLGGATAALEPSMRPLFRQVITGPLSALGASWFVSYLLFNGSLVAALSLSLFDAAVLTPPEVYLAVAGSRLGAAGVVLLLGALHYLQARQEVATLREGVSLGLLTFLVTHSLYLPASALGYASLPTLTAVIERGETAEPPAAPNAFDVVITTVIDVLGPAATFVVALALLFACLRLFDRLFDEIDEERLRERYVTALRNPWVSFLVGGVVTGVSTSVAFSLGVVVPLYNRDVVERREIVPYIMGASIGTLTDTLLVALVLGSKIGVAVVALLAGCASVVTLAALAVYTRYFAGIEWAHDRLLVDRPTFVAFVALLALVPLALVGIR